MKVKVMVVSGTRPEIIKLSPLIRLIMPNDDFSLIFVHSGQHYDDLLFKKFLTDLELPLPDYNLDVGSGDHSFHFLNII